MKVLGGGRRTFPSYETFKNQKWSRQDSKPRFSDTFHKRPLPKDRGDLTQKGHFLLVTSL